MSPGELWHSYVTSWTCDIPPCLNYNLRHTLFQNDPQINPKPTTKTTTTKCITTHTTTTHQQTYIPNSHWVPNLIFQFFLQMMPSSVNHHWAVYHWTPLKIINFSMRHSLLGKTMCRWRLVKVVKCTTTKLKINLFIVKDIDVKLFLPLQLDIMQQEMLAHHDVERDHLMPKKK